LFACEDWSQLGLDLDELGSDLVSLTLVADPFGAPPPSELRRWFDVVAHFKDHFVVDPRACPEAFVSSHHRRYAAKARRELRVERCEDPVALSNDWVRLYGGLVDRHRVRGMAAFSPRSLMKQLEVPGLVMFRAVQGKRTVGLTLWYARGCVAYYHLGAWDDAGYRARASFALIWSAIMHFRDRRQWVDLGGGAGLTLTDDDGLSRFKRGWATGSRPAYICGRIFDHERYRQLAEATGNSQSSYFPAYRTPASRA
jgi:hypothetical protein